MQKFDLSSFFIFVSALTFLFCCYFFRTCSGTEGARALYFHYHDGTCTGANRSKKDELVMKEKTGWQGI